MKRICGTLLEIGMLLFLAPHYFFARAGLYLTRDLVVYWWPTAFFDRYERWAILIWLSIVPALLALVWAHLVALVLALVVVAEWLLTLLTLLSTLTMLVCYYATIFDPDCAPKHYRWIAFVAAQQQLWFDVKAEFIFYRVKARVLLPTILPAIKRFWQDATSFEWLYEYVKENREAMRDDLGEGIASAAIGVAIIALGVLVSLFLVTLFIGGFWLIGFLRTQVAGADGQREAPLTPSRMFGAPPIHQWLSAFDHWLYRLENITTFSFTRTPARLFLGALIVTVGPALLFLGAVHLFNPCLFQQWLWPVIIGAVLIGSITGWQLGQPANGWFVGGGANGDDADFGITLGDDQWSSN